MKIFIKIIVLITLICYAKQLQAQIIPKDTMKLFFGKNSASCEMFLSESKLYISTKKPAYTKEVKIDTIRYSITVNIYTDFSKKVQIVGQEEPMQVKEFDKENKQIVLELNDSRTSISKVNLNDGKVISYNLNTGKQISDSYGWVSSISIPSEPSSEGTTYYYPVELSFECVNSNKTLGDEIQMPLGLVSAAGFENPRGEDELEVKIVSLTRRAFKESGGFNVIAPYMQITSSADESYNRMRIQDVHCAYDWVFPTTVLYSMKDYPTGTPYPYAYHNASVLCNGVPNPSKQFQLAREATHVMDSAQNWRRIGICYSYDTNYADTRGAPIVYLIQSDSTYFVTSYIAPSISGEFYPSYQLLALRDKNNSYIAFSKQSSKNPAALFYNDATLERVSNDTTLYRINIPNYFTLEWKTDSIYSDVQEAVPIKKEINFYPNPANNILNIYFNSLNISNTKITILNTFGNKVKEINFNSIENEFKINISELPVGIYIIVLTAKDFSQSQKLVIIR